MKLTERVAVLTAMQKAVKAELDRARAEADGEMRRRFAEDGTDRMRLIIDGEEVGTLSLRCDGSGYEVTDEEAFHDYLWENGGLSVSHRLKPEYAEEAYGLWGADRPWMFESEEKPDEGFCKLMERVGDMMVVSGLGDPVPGVRPCGKRPKGVTVRGCDPRKVVPLLRSVGGVEALLLGEGER